jgi:hypothetical protein
VTCIAGITNKKKVWLMGDSAGIDANYGKMIHSEDKVWVSDQYVLGFTTSFRMGQLLKAAQFPEPPSEDILPFMTGAFVDCARKALLNGGFAQINKGQESGGVFIVGVKGHLFVIHSDYQVQEVLEHAAIGSGKDLALGSLLTTETSKMTPDGRLRWALHSASTYNAGVGPPYKMVQTYEEE